MSARLNDCFKIFTNNSSDHPKNEVFFFLPVVKGLTVGNLKPTKHELVKTETTHLRGILEDKQISKYTFEGVEFEQLAQRIKLYSAYYIKDMFYRSYSEDVIKLTIEGKVSDNIEYIATLTNVSEITLHITSPDEIQLIYSLPMHLKKVTVVTELNFCLLVELIDNALANNIVVCLKSKEYYIKFFDTVDEVNEDEVNDNLAAQINVNSLDQLYNLNYSLTNRVKQIHIKFEEDFSSSLDADYKERQKKLYTDSMLTRVLKLAEENPLVNKLVVCTRNNLLSDKLIIEI